LGEAVEAGGRRAFPSRQRNQNGALLAMGPRSPSSANDAFAVLPQNLEALIVEAEP